MATMFDGLENIDEEEFAKSINEEIQKLKENARASTLKEVFSILGEEEPKELLGYNSKTKTEDFTRQYRQIIKKLKYYDPVFIREWSLFDTWDIYSGLAILCDINPTSLSFDVDGNIQQPDGFCLTMLNGMKLSGPLLSDVLFGLATLNPLHIPVDLEIWQQLLLGRYSLLLKIWKSGNHTEDRYPPEYFLEWAINKGMEPRWLGWAKENGLIDNDNKPEIEDKEPTGKSRTSFQNAMAALFNELLAAKQEKNPKITKSAIIQKLMDKYSGVGIKESFLTKNINEGLKTLQTKQ